MDWKDSPIGTTITTRHISHLDFPNVTVCPPKNSHTALNYDLMKANNQSLTEEDREDLRKTAATICLSTVFMDYIKTMVDAANPSNIRHI